ncbi:MAG: MFS transporter [Deltaproteobacteria bacterium]|nr:MFS transporter [Deltaproteobacteria bacterium]
MKMLPSFKIADKGIFFIAVTQFGVAFSNNFIMVFMPFYILKISPFGPRETLLWIGFILGGTSIATAIFSPFWGGLTARFSPKLLFERGIFCSAVIILLMGYTESVYLLLLLRMTQGALGGASTIGLILTSALSPKEKLNTNIGFFQNAITAGQLLGPPVGAYAAATLGYHLPFLLAFLMLVVVLIFCHRSVRAIPPQQDPPRQSATLKKEILVGWFLCFIATVHLIFLPSILPRILADFKLTEKIALNAAGIIMMAYTAAAIVGSYILCNIAYRVGLKKIMTIALSMASFLQIFLIFGHGFWSFTAIRMLQIFFIAAAFPLTVSFFARSVGGKMIGFLNAARFFGNAVGPLMATSVLAYANLLALYGIIAVLTLGSLWAFLTLIKTGDEPCSVQDS